MTHVVKIDILTGYEEMINLHFMLKLLFTAYLSKDHAFSKTFTDNFESIAYCLTKYR